MNNQRQNEFDNVKSCKFYGVRVDIMRMYDYNHFIDLQ